MVCDVGLGRQGSEQRGYEIECFAGGSDVPRGWSRVSKDVRRSDDPTLM